MKNHIVNLLREVFPDMPLKKGQPFNDLLVEPAAMLNELLIAEMENVRKKMYLANYAEMTPDELDSLASNYLNFKRRISNKLIGYLRVYLRKNVDIIFPKDDPCFLSKDGEYFQPYFDFAVLAKELKFDHVKNLYYIDILVNSVNYFFGDEKIDIGDINRYIGNNEFIEGVENLTSFTVSSYLESNLDVYNRLVSEGVLINSTRNNFYSTLLLNTFPDIRKILVVGSGHPLMKRDLTFEYSNLYSRIENLNFFSKRSGSNVNNKNQAYKGWINTNDISNIYEIDILEDKRFEFSQYDYENVSFKDGNFVEFSTLLDEIYFYNFINYSNLIEEDLFLSESKAGWDTGSSYVKFTGEINTGIEIKGDYVADTKLIENERGVVLYKKIDDPRNKEFSLQFIIRDFETELPFAFEAETTTLNKITPTQNVVLSNNQPLYFTVLKKGKDDVESDFKSSAFDGYGVIIRKKYIDQRPNIFIVDGSTGISEVTIDEEILQHSSERILAAKYIPLESDIRYTCIMRVGSNYSLTVDFKDQYGSDVGQIFVGGFDNFNEYKTVYDIIENSEEKLKTDVVSFDNSPRNYTFINSNDENLLATGVINFKYLLTNSNNLKVNYVANNKKMIKIEDEESTIFKNVENGDIFEIYNNNYKIINKVNDNIIELEKEVILVGNENKNWKIWRNLVFGEDYFIPQTPIFNNITLYSIEKIKNVIGESNLLNLVFSLLYVQKNGIKKEITFSWNENVTLYKTFNVTTEDNIKLKETYIFNKEDLEENIDYFLSVEPDFNKISYIYLTQEGFDKIKTKYLRIKLREVDYEKTYLIEKNKFIKGYQVPINYQAGIKNITYIDKVYTDSNIFIKNEQYFVTEPEVTDITINPNDISLFFDKTIKIDYEVIGTGEYENIEVLASSNGDNKIYVSENVINNYYSVIYNNERYFIQSVIYDENSPFLNKKYKIILNKKINILNNTPIELRKKATSEISTRRMRFGYKYDLKKAAENKTTWEKVNTEIRIMYGSDNLIYNQDYFDDRLVPLNKVFISNKIYSLLNNNSIILFKFYKRIKKKEVFTDLDKKDFKPISNGSYLGVGFKNINNGCWNLLELKIRNLDENYVFNQLKFYFGDEITNEDRIFIDMNVCALSLNNRNNVNGVEVYIYNVLNSKWEFLYQNNAGFVEEGNCFLQYYDGEDLNKKYNFGYYQGSNFISLIDNFYLENYIDNNGYLNLLFISKSKNIIDNKSDIVFGEVRLCLNYINIIWQKDIGIHLGNKMDIYVASSINPSLEVEAITISEPTNILYLNDEFLKPILNVRKVESSAGVTMPFSFINLNSNLRFSSKEKLCLIFDYPLPAGIYYVYYDILPHIQIHQKFIDDINSSTDILIKNMEPVFLTLKINYSGNINEANVKDILLKRIKYSNVLYFNDIYSILKENGAESVFIPDGILVKEYDKLIDVQEFTIYDDYVLKETKYFSIDLNNIILEKI